MADPSPVITPFRVLTFLVSLSTALSLLEIVPAEIKPWLVVASTVISLALTIFFGTPNNPSIASRIANRFRKPAAAK